MREEKESYPRTASEKQIDLKEICLVSLVLVFLIAVFLWKLLFGQAFLPVDIINVRYPWRSYFLSSNQTIAEPHNSLLSDSVMAYYPDAHFLYSSIRQGIIPLWNPYIYGGLPFDGIAWLSSPADIPFLFLPVPLAYGYSAALRLFLSGIFMYFLIRTIGSGVLGSLIGAIVFMFNSNTVAWLSFPAHLNAELWMPLIFLLLFKTLSQRKISLAILTGGVLGLHFLSGYLQISLYLLLALLVCLVWTLLTEYKRSKRLVELRKPLLLFSVIIFIGLLIGAVAIIPFKESIDLSIRLSQARGPGEGYPLPYVVTFLVPNFFGNPADHNFWGPWGNYTESVKYFGILPLILAAIAVAFRKAQSETRRYSDLFLCMASLSILVALGGHSLLYPLLLLIPYFYASNAIRILSLFAFSLSVLSGLGGNLLEKEIGEAFRNQLSKYLNILFWILLYLVIFLILLVVVRLPETIKEFLQSLINYEIMNVLQLLFWIASSFSLLALFINRRLPRKWFSLSLILLIVLDLFAAGINYNTFIDPATVYPATESTDFLREDHTLYRILPAGGFTAFIPNSAMVYGISSVGGYNPLCTQRYWEYISLIDGAQVTPNGVLFFTKYTQSRLVDLLNVKYIVAPPTEDLTLKEDVVQDLSDAPVGEIWGSNTHGQTFLSHHPNLTAISIMLATYGRFNGYNTTFHLKDSPLSERDVITITFNNSQVENNAYCTFRFPPIIDSENKRFYFYLESLESLPGNAITIWASSADSYSEGERYVNGVPSKGDLRFRTFYETATNLSLVYNGEVKIYENLDWMPRAFVVHQAKVIQNREEILKELRSERFDPMGYVILEEGVTNEMLNGQPLSEGSSLASVTSYSPNKVVVNAKMAGSGFLIFADTYDSNWEVYVDGKRDRIYVADYVLRAVYLNKGEHIVEFVYNPHVFRILLYLSLSTLLVVAAVAFLAIYRRGFVKSLKRLRKVSCLKIR